MKPLLIVVPLHPKRECRAKTWLETKETRACADVKYLEPLPLGAPIFGKDGQLYTGAAIGQALFEAVIAAWRQAADYKFFGLCNDDVVIETPNFLREAMKMLTAGPAEATGTPIREMPNIEYFERKMDVLMRCWVAVRRCLSDVNWDVLWKRYELPEFEASWMHYSKIETRVFPELKWNHLEPVSRDCSDLSRGSVLERYEGNKRWVGEDV